MIKSKVTLPAPDMAALQKSYVEQLKSLFPEIIQLKNALTSSTPRFDGVTRLSGLVHTLSGLGTTVGFPGISENGGRLEHMLIAMDLADVAQKKGSKHIELMRHLEAFEKSCHQAVMSVGQADNRRDAMQDGKTAEETGKIVCILAKAGRPLRDLDKQLEHFGYVITCTPDIEKFKEHIVNMSPHVVIVYSDLSDADVAVMQGLPKPKNMRSYPPQLIVVSSQDTFEARLAAVRLGAQGFFLESADALQMIDKIEHLAAKFVVPATYHVLLVDDDDVQVRFYTHVLQAAGIMTTVVTAPHDVLEVIANQAIDMVLMDFIMPECNGQELATIIRQHEKYVSLPIIFLSARDDLEELLLNTGLGIDDFLVKPVTADHLVSVVRSRTARSAELQVLMARDSFTGLLNHAHFMDMLNMELGQVRRFKTNTVYASIDIDHFKNINDTYGHGAGDNVIRSLSRMLQQRLRRSDIIGRCGGEEFGIIMPDCTIENASLIIESMRLQFAEMPFKADNKEFRVTFSGGLALLGNYESLDDLIKAADKALYDAKNQGRNRLAIANKA